MVLCCLWKELLLYRGLKRLFMAARSPVVMEGRGVKLIPYPEMNRNKIKGKRGWEKTAQWEPGGIKAWAL